MRLKVSLLTISFLLSACAFALGAQGNREYVDKLNGFKITLSGRWQPVAYTDAIGRQRSEFVWETRDQGLLRIARQNLGGRSVSDMVRNEIEELKLGHACVFTGQEAFTGGSLAGIRVSLYYFEGSRRISGVFYFLQDKDAVWILRFNGQAGSPALTRDTTDAVARSFCSVCSL